MEIGFKKYHPITNLIFFISIAVFGMLFKHPVTLAVCFVSSLIYYIRLCKKSAVKTLLTFLLPMLLFVLLFNGLFSHYGTTNLLQLPDGNMLTLEAMVYGFVLGLSTVYIIMWIFCYNEVVTADKFMAVFGKAVPAAALVISMALRFLPMYQKRYKAISEAQKGIGCGNEKPIKKFGKILSVLTSWALENSVETSDSMRARGYGLKGRKSYDRLRWTKKDTVTLAVILLCDIIMLSGYIKGSLYCVYNPFTVINPDVDFGKTYIINELNLTVNPLTFSGKATLAAFVTLCLVPIIIDLKEEIKWNRLKSKI